MTARSLIRLLWMTSVIGGCAALLTLEMLHSGFPRYSPTIAALALTLGLIVWITAAGTVGAALTGTLFAACLSALGLSFVHSALPGLVLLFIVTTAATRFRRGVKLSRGLAEPSSRRSAAQVVANLGAAAIFAVMAGQTRSASLHTAMVAAVVATLAEATADTLSSELGETFEGRVVMITTWKNVPSGTDGGITAKGTVVGLLGALAVTTVCALTMQLPFHTAAAALGAAAAGFFIDSFLGATLENRGYIGNNEVNFLSTLASALIAVAITLA